jgi:hypothetical protein
MKIEIANPIYDVVFKYMMEDNVVAKLLISSIIGEEIVRLQPKPQEYTVDRITAEGSSVTVYRLDFSAKIKTVDGHKLVIIEMQKASFPADIMRFRGYLGKQYADENNSVERDDGTLEALPIYSIYFLGEELGIRKTPVLKVFPCIMDLGDEETIDVRNEFIDSLNHHSWIVQISCMKEPRRNELELLLSVFDQHYRSSNHHILNVREEDFPKKYRPLIRRLKKAAAIPEVKEQMTAEDEILRYLQNLERLAAFKERKKLEVEMAQKMAQKNEELVKNRKALDENKKALDEKDKALDENRKALDENKQTIEELRRQVAELQRMAK